MQLRLSNLENSHKSLSRLIRMYANDEIPSGKFRDLVYAFSHHLGYYKLIKECELENRIQAIEDKLNEK